MGVESPLGFLRPRSLEAPQGQISIKGMAVQVEATGPLKVKGATAGLEASGPATVRGATVSIN